MAESFTPITQANPGAASGVGNSPFTASFWAAVAANNFATERALSEDQRATRQTNAGYEYNRGLNARAEPLKLMANRNAANTQGLAESGVLAQRQGQTQTGYAQKNARLGETRRNAVEKYQGAEKNAVTDYNLKIAQGIAGQQEKGIAQAEAEGAQPTTAQAPAAAPQPPRVISQSPQKTTLSPKATGPKVISSKQQPTTPSPRKAAIRKAVG